jgi:hypothetical protein
LRDAQLALPEHVAAAMIRGFDAAELT